MSEAKDEPLARCGVTSCLRALYEHSTPCMEDNCPLRGEAWIERKRAMGMRNAFRIRST